MSKSKEENNSEKKEILNILNSNITLELKLNKILNLNLIGRSNDSDEIFLNKYFYNLLKIVDNENFKKIIDLFDISEGMYYALYFKNNDLFKYARTKIDKKKLSKYNLDIVLYEIKNLSSSKIIDNEKAVETYKNIIFLLKEISIKEMRSSDYYFTFSALMNYSRFKNECNDDDNKVPYSVKEYKDGAFIKILDEIFIKFNNNDYSEISKRLTPKIGSPNYDLKLFAKEYFNSFVLRKKIFMEIENEVDLNNKSSTKKRKM